MKKLICLLLVAVMFVCLAFSLSGCFGKADADQNIQNNTNADVLDLLGMEGKTGNADDYLFFSKIKPGMTPEEVASVTEKSGWHEDVIATYEEAYEYVDRDAINSLGSKALFTKEGNVIYSDVTFKDGMVVSTRIDYEFYGKDLSVDEFKAEAKVLYDKFVSSVLPTDAEEQITDDVTKLEDYYDRSYPMVESHGYDERVIQKGYNLDFKEYHVWYSEGSGIGYACFMMHYADPEGNTVSQMMFAMYVK